MSVLLCTPTGDRISMLRFVDDTVLFGESEENLANGIATLFCKDLGLKINAKHNLRNAQQML